MADPALTVIVGFFDMRREAERTLFTLSPEYQRGVGTGDYEVVAIDNGSPDPLTEAEVTRFGPNFRLVTAPAGEPSPAAAINRVAAEVSTPWVMCAIDGARMLTPGILAGAFTAFAQYAEPFVYTIGMHLGPAFQNKLAAEGHDQEAEDRLLESVDWRENGYRLFRISSPALSVEKQGLFSGVRESNCFALRREKFVDTGGFDTRFRSPGGGLVNVDVFKRLYEDPGLTPVCLLGEATFHQFHGGVATNVPWSEHPGLAFEAEWESIHGSPVEPPNGPEPVYLGSVPEEARHLVRSE